MQFFEFVIYASSRHGEHGFIAVDWAVFHGDLLVDCFACMEREEGLIMTKNKIANNSTFPSFDSLINSVFKALVHLGGSASIDEIYETVIELEKFDESVTSIRQNSEKSNQTVLEYELGWARSYLKKYFSMGKANILLYFHDYFYYFCIRFEINIQIMDINFRL